MTDEWHAPAADHRTISLDPNGSILLRPAERHIGLEGVELSVRDERGTETTWQYLPLEKVRVLRDALSRYLSE